nr:hypothetical protein BgiMline_027428 [Biomphalaria glabrata]
MSIGSIRLRPHWEDSRNVLNGCFETCEQWAALSFPPSAPTSTVPQVILSCRFFFHASRVKEFRGCKQLGWMSPRVCWEPPPTPPSEVPISPLLHPYLQTGLSGASIVARRRCYCSKQTVAS